MKKIFTVFISMALIITELYVRCVVDMVRKMLWFHCAPATVSGMVVFTHSD